MYIPCEISKGSTVLKNLEISLLICLAKISKTFERKRTKPTNLFDFKRSHILPENVDKNLYQLKY